VQPPSQIEQQWTESEVNAMRDIRDTLNSISNTMVEKNTKDNRWTELANTSNALSANVQIVGERKNAEAAVVPGGNMFMTPLAQAIHEKALRDLTDLLSSEIDKLVEFQVAHAAELIELQTERNRLAESIVRYTNTLTTLTNGCNPCRVYLQKATTDSVNISNPLDRQNAIRDYIIQIYNNAITRRM
jgi:hypothetical protein